MRRNAFPDPLTYRYPEWVEIGPYLFGRFGIADAMFAPVVLRVRSYGLPLSELSRRYQETMLSDAHLGEWIEASGRETQVIPYEEVGAGA